MADYLTRQGEVLDDICRVAYGRTDVIADVLAANPGLADLGPLLPYRTRVFLPDLPAPRHRPRRAAVGRVMKPVFRIVAGGEDVTAPVGDRLQELRILDAAGTFADTLSLTLDDRDERLVVPPHQMRIHATAADMNGPIRAPRTHGGRA